MERRLEFHDRARWQGWGVHLRRGKITYADIVCDGREIGWVGEGIPRTKEGSVKEGWQEGTRLSMSDCAASVLCVKCGGSLT